MKVAFQAGVLQVWLDEAGLEFDHLDAASGGVFNQVMLCQGMTGTEVADNWRGVPFWEVVHPNWRELRKPFTGESLIQLDRLRSRIFTRWGLDWEAIRSTPTEATFSAYNFTRHELAVFTAKELTEDLLVACISLPMWFPPVRVGGETYIDAVYVTDANLLEAIRRGADELWIIWTVSERSEWHGGFLGQYFGIIETAGNGHFRRDLARIAASNAAIARGEQGEFNRPIEVKLLRAEVPLHYIVNLNPDRFTQAVERGVEAGRRWCAEQGIAFTARQRPRVEPGAMVGFRERMRGPVRLGAPDAEVVEADRGGAPVRAELQVLVDDIDRLVLDRGVDVRVEGRVECSALGGVLTVERGTLDLLVDGGDPARRRSRYRLHLRDPTGRPLTLSGVKRFEQTGRGLWHDATTFYARILEGHVSEEEEAEAPVLAAGALSSRARDLPRRLASLRAKGDSRSKEAAAIARLLAFYAGGIWDVYGRERLSSSPL